MADVWNTLAERADELSDSIFVKLEKGDKIVGVFLGDPHPKEVVWTGEIYVDANSAEGRALTKRGKKPTFRAAINIFVPDEEAVKIFEMSAPTFRDMFKLRQKYGLAGWAFEIEKQTKSKYTILPEKQLSDEQKRRVAALELHDLGQIISGSSEGDFDSYDKSEQREDTPKSRTNTLQPAALEELMGRLKQLPRAAVDRFLGKFGVQRVRDLPSSRKDEAFATLEALERSGIDPFE
ncbi:MAG: hypothetical protein MJE77_18080 [Proteobacteria bacterium]|nr:hypothetical protein [Pseudomonadota bacterium]